MGVAKAALEASVRYLAADLGPDGVRVNAITAGPVRTLAAAGIAGFKGMYGSFADVAPLRANITTEDVGRTALWLASDLSSAVTGEVDLRRRRLQHHRVSRPATDPGGAGRLGSSSLVFDRQAALHYKRMGSPDSWDPGRSRPSPDPARPGAIRP